MTERFCLANGSKGIPYIKADIFDSFMEISHGYSTRMGGVSKVPYESLNVGIAVGDRIEDVRENRDIISGITGAKKTVYLSQVHGSDVLIIRKNDDLPDHDIIKSDAAITDKPGLMLVIQTADCQAILLYDPEKKVVAAVHSGWRGNVLNIIGETVSKMASEFGSDPSSLLASIGPSLGPCCAEFINYRKELPESFWGYGNEDKLFDFWEISMKQLMEAGLDKKNIWCAGLCTRCRDEYFFSYRRSGITGRMAGFIVLND